MYASEKTYREQTHNKPKKNVPSFSSTLLDEIYRSIDVAAEKSDNLSPCKEKMAKNQSGFRAKANITEDEETRILIRACLVEKWMEKERIEKSGADLETETKSLHDNGNDLLFFSSTSSSNSDSSGALSSSDTEFFASQTTPKVSCFSSTRLKPVRTGVSAREVKNNSRRDCSVTEDDSIKYRSKALKIYENMKKIKQPISPGMRLTSFINSIFSNAKAKSVDSNKKFPDSTKPPKAQSACSFSRSCLSKYSPRSREKLRSVDQRTVRFHPVSVIVGEDSRPCGHKCIYGEDSDKYGKPPLPLKALADIKVKKNRKVGEKDLKGYNGNIINNIKWRDDFSMFRKIEGDDDDGDDFDRISDSSSDLFELDFGNNKFREELPVYETTRLDPNRIVASRLIR